MRPRGPYRRPLKDMEAVVAELYRRGSALRDIAELAGCSVIAVKGALARAGQPLRPRGSHATAEVIDQRRRVLAELSRLDLIDLDAVRRHFALHPPATKTSRNPTVECDQ